VQVEGPIAAWGFVIFSLKAPIRLAACPVKIQYCGSEANLKN